MKSMQAFSIDSKVLSSFNKIIPLGERSTKVEELILSFVQSKSLDKNQIKIQRELERKQAEERLAKLMSIEKAEADRELAENERRQNELLAQQRNFSNERFKDGCRKKAKILVNLEFGLDPLIDILPSSFSEDKRSRYRSRWKELTDKLIQDGEKESEKL